MELSICTPEPVLNWTPFFDQVGIHLRASSMTLRAASEDKFKVQFAEGEDPERDPCFRLEARSAQWRDDPFRLWLAGVKGLPLDDIESLTTDVSLDTADWKETPWKNIPSLRRLTLQNGVWTSYLEHLTAPEEEEAVECNLEWDVPFASLEELSLHEVQSVGAQRQLKNIPLVLNQRMKEGFKLRKLSFDHCRRRVPKDILQQLVGVN